MHNYQHFYEKSTRLIGKQCTDYEFNIFNRLDEQFLCSYDRHRLSIHYFWVLNTLQCSEKHSVLHEAPYFKTIFSSFMEKNSCKKKEKNNCTKLESLHSTKLDRGMFDQTLPNCFCEERGSVDFGKLIQTPTSSKMGW